MRLLFTLLFLTLGSTFVSSNVAQAADLEDLDSSSSSKRSKKAKAARSPKGSEQEVVREIVKGYFLKANAGTTIYLGSHSALLQSGTALSLSGGGEFIDRENMSMAWEVVFDQGLHNGLKYTEQGNLLLSGQIGTNQLSQGDLHTFSILAMVEASWYVNRRFGIGVRGGGGVMLTPPSHVRGHL